MKPRCLGKKLFSGRALQGRGGKDKLRLERFIRKILDHFMAEGHLANTIFRTMCS